MRFGHGRIVGNYGKADNERWFHEFSDDPDTYRVFLAECARVLRQDRHVYIMFDSFSMLSLGALVRECFDVKGVIVWDKMHLGMGHYFRRRHEQIVFASKGRRKVSRRDMPDVWAVPRIHRAAYPTQKPVRLFEMMLEASAGARLHRVRSVLRQWVIGRRGSAFRVRLHRRGHRSPRSRDLDGSPVVSADELRPRPAGTGPLAGQTAADSQARRLKESRPAATPRA